VYNIVEKDGFSRGKKQPSSGWLLRAACYTKNGQKTPKFEAAARRAVRYCAPVKSCSKKCAKALEIGN